LAIARGGTGAGTAVAAFDALSPVTTLGDIIFRDASNNVRLAGNITTTKQFLTQTGTGSVSAAPVWAAILSGDLPSHNHNASDINAGTLPVARGGTGAIPASARVLLIQFVPLYFSTSPVATAVITTSVRSSKAPTPAKVT